MQYISSDEELVNRALRQDEQAWIELDERYRRTAFGWCMYRLKNRDEAEECTAETMFRIHSRLHRFDPLRGRFRNWAWTICRDVLVDRLRRLKVAPTVPLEAVADTLIDPAPGPETVYKRRRAEQALEQELAFVPERVRRALGLVRDGSSIRAAARSENMDEHTLRYHLRRLISRVRLLLSGRRSNPDSEAD
ncbi:MAG: sigma-70 family RNA polymerase sigma factor [candidate division WOR-3 bacterium]